jgi:predicted transcriptional regulator
MTQSKNRFVGITADIVAAYVSSNAVPATGLTGLIAAVHTSLRSLAEGKASASVPLKPAVPIKASVTPDFIICLEDGKKLKSLRRHLRMRYGLSPEQYRAKWGLPATYPMVAPNYGAYRSQLAKSTGLGRKPKASARSAREVAQPTPSRAAQPKKHAAAAG